VIGYTSGTTADPKGVIHTHRSFVAEIRQLAAIQPEGDRPALVAAPVAHAIGMLGGLLLPLYRGRAIHLTDVWRPAAVLDAMRAADLTAGSGATVFLTSLRDAPGFSVADAARLGRVGLGGAPVPVAVAERAEALGIGVARVYGSTEHPSTTGSLPDASRAKRNRTDGRALAGVELRLVDGDGRDVACGEPGGIWSRGPDLCAAHTDPVLTRAAFDADGWFASGDIGVLDADGYLTITDRKKDIIIRGGANISAAEIEELLAQLPGVAEVAVVAAPDARLGEHACAFVRPRDRDAAPDLAAVRRHLETAGLAKPKWPEELRIVEDFPRTRPRARSRSSRRATPCARSMDEGPTSERAPVYRRSMGRGDRSPHGHFHVTAPRRRAHCAPLWFVVVDRRIYVSGPARAKRVTRVRRDPRVSFLVESGTHWADLLAVHFTGRVRVVTEPALLARVAAALDVKYAAFRTSRQEMPAATRAHYEVNLATIEITPDEHILSWDNSRLGLGS
jgi:hypothetical protein